MTDFVTVYQSATSATYTPAQTRTNAPVLTLITPTRTPSSATDTGVAGTIVWDTSFIYVCTATNVWKRVAIATWP